MSASCLRPVPILPPAQPLLPAQVPPALHSHAGGWADGALNRLLEAVQVLCRLSNHLVHLHDRGTQGVGVGREGLAGGLESMRYVCGHPEGGMSASTLGRLSNQLVRLHRRGTQGVEMERQRAAGGRLPSDDLCESRVRNVQCVRCA